MPPTRRSTKKQATLTFNHRVTKTVPKSAKGISTAPAKKSPLGKHVINAESVAKEEEPAPVVKALKDEPVVAPERKKTPAELRADKITSRQISQYWHTIEKGRKTKTIHQEKLSLAEKILRYWDVSSQYGPCVGISRMKRWQRADKLGLNPPIEILAVLMNEENEAVQGIERAHMDEILNGNAAGAS